jgi:serine/threonine-protein kinase
VITRRLTQPPPSARESRPDVPESLDRVVLKALARSPAERFAGAAELRDALAEVIAGAATQRPAPAGQRRDKTAGGATAGKPEPTAPPPSAPPAEKTKAPKTRPAPPPPAAEPARVKAPATARSTTAPKSSLARVPRSVWLALAGTATLAIIAVVLTNGGPDDSTTPTQTVETSAPAQPQGGPATQARVDSTPPAVTRMPVESTRVASGEPGRTPDSAQRRTQQTVQQAPPPRGRETQATRQTPPPVVTPPRAQRDSPVTAAVQRDTTTGARATQQAPPPPTTPSTAAVDSVRAFFAQASRLEDNGDYAGAFRSLGDAAARIVQLRAAFPTASVLTTLDQEHRDRRSSTVRACQAFREVRISLGLTPPDCPAS